MSCPIINHLNKPCFITTPRYNYLAAGSYDYHLIIIKLSLVMLLSNCLPTDDQHQAQLITSTSPNAQVESADAMPHDADVELQNSADATADTDATYPSIAKIKQQLAHSTATQSNASDHHNSPQESTAAPAPTAEEHQKEYQHITQLSSPTYQPSAQPSPSMDSTAKHSASTCSELLTSRFETITNPTMLFTKHPLATGFVLDDLSQFLITTPQPQAKPSINLPVSFKQPSPDSTMFAVKTQSMNIEFGSGIQGELILFNSLSSTSGIHLDFLDQQKISQLEHLHVHWKSMIEISNSEVNDDGELKANIATILKSLLNQGIVLNLNELIQLQPHEVIFSEIHSFAGEIVTKEDRKVIFADITTTAPLKTTIQQKILAAQNNPDTAQMICNPHPA